MDHRSIFDAPTTAQDTGYVVSLEGTCVVRASSPEEARVVANRAISAAASESSSYGVRSVDLAVTDVTERIAVTTVTVKINTTVPNAAEEIARLIERYGPGYIPGFTGSAEIDISEN